MKKILFALLVAPTAANAQVPVYPQQDAPRDIDPGTNAPPTAGNPTMAPGPTRPAPAPPTQQKPNVIVVGPDGKVTYDPTQSQQTPGGYYYTPDNPDQSFGYEPGDESAVYAGPTPELHVVRTGDTLWDLCSMYFNDPWQWPKIWSYNPQITNPHWIYPGDLVRLLPRGMFAQQRPEVAPEQAAPEAAQENLPAPLKRTTTDLKQTAFVEKANLDQSITIDGSVDEKELLGPGDSVYLSYPSNNPPKIGQRYSIYKADNTVKSNGNVVGAFVRILGSLEVVSVKQDKRARGVIVESNQEIERGAKVGALVKQYKNVTPVAPKVDAQGSIVAMLTKEQLIGEGEIVFVDLGANSGVEVGNRMFVVRRGDAKPPQSKSNVGQDDRRFPTRTLGQVVIVEVGKNISVGKVTVSVQEMGLGDLVMMQKQQ
ncbi:MAG: LysM peptidoglycan-binding domain-containing protein [Kofleriaceae bacterium]|nr:LysM peptidoglycan-binding domain-containing protein [Kofleriaceae bacterium]